MSGQLAAYSPKASAQWLSRPNITRLVRLKRISASKAHAALVGHIGIARMTGIPVVIQDIRKPRIVMPIDSDEDGIIAGLIAAEKPVQAIRPALRIDRIGDEAGAAGMAGFRPRKR